MLKLRWTLVMGTLLFGCGGGGGSGTEADRLGVGAECTESDDCALYTLANDDAGERQLSCLTAFKGGYCGLTDCASGLDCPAGSICVAHDDGHNYCFRQCTDKIECNANRTLENESNCSSSFDWATPSDDNGGKACIPPSSGTK